MSSRGDTLLRGIPKSARIIEIGPSYNPLAAKRDGWNAASIDHATQSELVEKYRNDPAVDVSQIEPVDFVWRGGAMSAAVPTELHGTFDVFVASHVIEHVPDVIGFLNAASDLLNSVGCVVLAVPDKRYCFDFFKPLTTTGEVLGAHHERRNRHERRAMFDHAAYAALNDGIGAWGQAPVGDLRLISSLDDAYRRFNAVDESEQSAYKDCHATQFVPASFELIMLELAALRLTDWRIASISPAIGCEFHVRLSRGGQTDAAALTHEALMQRRLDLLKRAMLEVRDQVNFMAPPEADAELKLSGNALESVEGPARQKRVSPFGNILSRSLRRLRAGGRG